MEVYGVYVNNRDQSGKTPLHLTSDGGYLNLVKYLVLECKININTKDYSAMTSLHLALICDNLEIVGFLLSMGAKYDDLLEGPGLNEYQQKELKALIDEVD